MTYRLKFNEPLGKGWRRIVREQIEQARELLASGQDVDGAIHETRKSMKRVRALLKLLRPGLSASDYKRQNRRYRDITRVLSGVRDHAVLMATARSLYNETAGEARAATNAFLSQMSQGSESGAGDRQAAAPGVTKAEKAARVHEALAALEAALKSLEKLRFKENSFAVVRRGVERSYRDARNDMKQAFGSGVDEDFHAWRKSVQAHWRHMLLVGRAWPDLFAARAQLAKEMSDLLGLDHDLFVLIGRAKSFPEQGAEDGGRDAMVRAAKERQREIRKELEIKAAALFAEPTSRFVASVDAYWHAAKGARKLEKKRAREKAAPSPATGNVAQRKSARVGTRSNGQQAGTKCAASTKRGFKAGAGAGQAGTVKAAKKTAAAKAPAAKRRMQGSGRGAAKRRTPPGKA